MSETKSNVSSFKRDNTIELLHGPAIEVAVISPSGETSSWSVPKALLSHNSAYFQRACRESNFREGEERKVTLSDFDIDTFKLFIEFIYYGEYAHRDNLKNDYKIHDSAKAWVLGDYLDATEFQNFAIRFLYSVYLPANNAVPKAKIGPKMVEYCCSNSAPNSDIVKLIIDFLIKHWHDSKIIKYNIDNREKWEAIWDDHSYFRNEILWNTNQSAEVRADTPRGIERYLENLQISDEMAASSHEDFRVSLS